MKKVILTINDMLAARVFFDCGIVGMLADELRERLEIVSTFDLSAYRDWISRLDHVKIHTMDEFLSPRGHTLLQTIHGAVDGYLDKKIGFFPLAIRFNLKHGLHLDRMEKGHANQYLDNSRIGPLPLRDDVYAFMFRWLYSDGRYLAPALAAYLTENASAIVASHLQHQSTVPFILGAGRLHIPLIGYIASWDHLVGKGVVYPHAKRYIVQNNIMRRDLIHYHHIDAERISVTGWPQTDIFSRKRPKEKYIELLNSFGLDPAKPCVLIAGNSVTNAPYEPAFFARLLTWWEESGARNRMNLIFRPHPKDTLWKQRYDISGISSKRGIYLQSPTYTDMEVLALMLQHVACVVTNAGTILLDSLVNDRPVVSVQYDEGTETGSSFAVKNLIGLHYRELVESNAYYNAGNFDEVTRGINSSLSNPEELSEARHKVTRLIVGEVDGMAAQRVANAILSSLNGN